MISNISTETIKKQQIPKLRTRKIAYWVFCAFRYNREFEVLIWSEIHTIHFPNFKRIRIQIIFEFGKSCKYKYKYTLFFYHLNTNRFENICRIRISLFGLNYSNTIRITNYSLTSGLEGLLF